MRGGFLPLCPAPPFALRGLRWVFCSCHLTSTSVLPLRWVSLSLGVLAIEVIFLSCRAEEGGAGPGCLLPSAGNGQRCEHVLQNPLHWDRQGPTHCMTRDRVTQPALNALWALQKLHVTVLQVFLLPSQLGWENGCLGGF